jgi:hypothetical protein
MKLSNLIVPFADHAAKATTVAHLVDALAPPILRVLGATQGLDKFVNGTVLHDRLEPLPKQPGAVLLLSGLRTDSSEALSLIDQAADYDYSAVVVKRRDADASEMVSAASTKGLVILAVADELPWQQLDALILSVIGAQGLEALSATGSGGELFAIANAVASVIGGSVSIEGIDRRVLAYSSVPNQRIDSLRQRGILDRRVPDMERNLGQYRSVLAAEGVVRFPEAPDEFARSAIAIRAGARPLGTIWAIEELGDMAGDGDRVLRDAARLAALHLLRGRSPSLMELEVKEATMKAALDGSLEPDEVAYRLGLGGGASLALVGFAAAPDSKGTLPLITHIGNAITRYVAAFRPDAAIATTSRAVYVLLPSGGLAEPDLLAGGALSAVRQVFDDGMRAAISTPHVGVAALGEMRREVDDILRVITQQSGLPLIAKLADVQSEVLVSHVSDEFERHPRLRHPGIDAMVAHDAEQKTEYAASVLAWLDAFGDMVVASDILHIHSNTLRYRLKRMGELFDVTLDNPNDRLSIWLQLRADHWNRQGVATSRVDAPSATVG